jgi:RecA-family ATPase
MISGEDDPDDTIVPRLIVAGADLSIIHIINDVVKKRDGELSVLSLDQHMKSIDSMVQQCKASLLVIDPVSAFMGDRDSHKDSAVRALLNKVRQYAIDGNYAVLLVTHFNKPGEKSSSAAHRVMGSLGFVAAARSVYAFVKDPADPDRRLFLPIKNNLGLDKDGFSCSIKVKRKRNLTQPAPYLQWDDEAVEGQRVDEIMTQASPRAQAQKEEEQEIREWLDGFVKPGKRVRATKFNDELDQQGFSKRKVRKLMPKLGYYRKQEKKFQGGWWVNRKKTQ